MPMVPVVNLTCRIQGHKETCNKTATLQSEGGGFTDHTHRCLRCGDFTHIEREELDPMVEAMLRMALPESHVAFTVDLDWMPRARSH